MKSIKFILRLILGIIFFIPWMIIGALSVSILGLVPVLTVVEILMKLPFLLMPDNGKAKRDIKDAFGMLLMIPGYPFISWLYFIKGQKFE